MTENQDSPSLLSFRPHIVSHNVMATSVKSITLITAVNIRMIQLT